VALALDRLCEAGLVEKDAVRILVSARRKGGGGELRFLKFRRKRSDGAPNATTPKSWYSIRIVLIGDRSGRAPNAATAFRANLSA
jgi:hypothetical protein